MKEIILVGDVVCAVSCCYVLLRRPVPIKLKIYQKIQNEKEKNTLILT